MDTEAREEFEVFFDGAERRLRLALTGAFGFETGRDAAAEALTWAWHNWHRVRTMENRIGYLYTVGRTAALRAVGHDAPISVSSIDVLPAAWELPNFEPHLARYLAGLSEHQRLSLWMIHGLGFTHAEVAELLDCTRATVATHVRRGLRKLRHDLGVEHG